MSVLHLTGAAFDQAVSQGVALVDFWAGWCMPCKMLAPVIEDLAGQYEGRAVVAKVDIVSEPDLASRFGVMSIPTVILFKDGKELERKVGVMPVETYTGLLDANL